MLLLGGLLVAFISFDFIHTEVSSNGAAGASEDGRIDNVHEKETCSQSELNCPSPDGKDSVYGPRSDCSQFCQCSNGVPYLHNCPSGLHFNPVLNVCDWPERAGCVNNSDNENNGGDSTDGGDAVDEGEGSAGGDNGSGDGGDGNEEKDKVQLCSQSELNCPSPDGKNSVYGPRSDCSQFCQCSNGVPYLHNCPSGLHFNPVLNVCDWPERAGCVNNSDNENNGGDSTDGGDAVDEGEGNAGGDNGSGDGGDGNEEKDKVQLCSQSELNCPSPDGKNSVYGPRSDCSQFCQCSNGVPYLHNCPSGLHFNPVLNVCDWPERAGCVNNSDNENNGGDSTDGGDAVDEGEGNAGGDNGSGDGGDGNEEKDKVQLCSQSELNCPSPDGKDSVYGPRSDCSQFCQCSNGVPYLHNCPSGLHFNPVLNVCDWPERAGCVNNSDNENNGGDSTDGGDAVDEGEGSAGGDNGSGDGGDGNEEKDKVQLCSQSELNCPSPDGKNSVYGPRSDCSQFCQCSNGVPYLHNCPSGLHFNPVLNVCDWPERAGCVNNSDNENNGGDSTDGGDAVDEGEGNAGGDNGSGDGGDGNEEKDKVQLCSQSELNCPSPDGKNSVYGPRSDCSQFCQCSNGVPYLHNCPSGLHFNPVLNVCDWPERAGCVNNSDNENNGGDSTDGGDAVDEGEGNAGGDNGSGDGGDGNEEKDKVQLCSQSELNCPSPDGKDSVYGPRSDCSQFCQCSNGVPYLHNCPSGLHFNPVLNVCDWPERAGCVNNSDNENNGGDSTDGGDAVDEGEGSAGGDNGSGDGGDGNEEKDKVQLCSQSELNCPSPDGKDSVYGPRSDCSQFCQCSNGVPYLHNCPSGLHFNPVLNVCDWPERAGCVNNSDNENNGGDSTDGGDAVDEGEGNAGGDNGSGDGGDGNEEKDKVQLCSQSELNCPSPDGKDSVYGPRSDCSQFCQCSNGVAYLHNCPSGLHFNPDLNVCDWPESAGCLHTVNP